MRELTEGGEPPHEESRRLFTLLILGSLVIAVLILWTVTAAFGAPLFVAFLVALFFLCLDSLAIVIVWYGMRRR